MIVRFLTFIGTILLSLFVTPLIAGPVAIYYALRWFAPELILLGSLFDVYFGAIDTWPTYTLGGFLIVLASEIGKRYLFFIKA